MADDTNEIISTSPSKLDIYTKLMDIAGKYTDIENTDYLNNGLFGYMTESMAMMIRDSSYHKSMLYNESFLNTAVIPQSVYNWAKMFNIEISKASPAYATIKIYIPQDSIEEMLSIKTNGNDDYGSDIENIGNEYFIIDKSNMIVAGEYYFSLEHSILFRKIKTTSYRASYITSEPETTSYQTVNARKNLPIYVDGSNYVIEARAYQYKTTTYSRQMSSSRMMNKVQTFSFDDQFAGAKLYYCENGSSDRKEIELRYSNIGNSKNAAVAYYNLNDENTLEITFKGGSEGFIPAPNSKIILDLYSTKGSNVPNNYTGTAIFKFGTDDQLRKFGIVISFDPTTIIGGADVPSTEKVKQTIIRQLSTCNTIVTESDLNNYFEVLTGLLESINDGKATFVKRRDDILRRVFNAYLLLRDGKTDDGSSTETSSTFISRCIPTNTITATFPAAQISADSSLIYPKIVFNSDTQTYVGLGSEPATSYYFSPFYIFVELSPIKKIKYIYNLTDNTTSLSAIADTLSLGSGEYFNPVSVRVYRDLKSNEAAAEDSYHVEFVFSTNKSSLGKSIDLQINGISFFSGELGTNGSSYEYSEDDNTGTLRIPVNVNTSKEFDFTENYGMYIYLSRSASSGTKSADETNSERIPESCNIELTLSGTDSDDSATYSSDDKLYFFRSLDEIMLSELGVNTTTISATEKQITGVTIYDIPVVHSSFIKASTENQSSFVKQLFTYIDLLKENLEKLETSTFFDMKFYNTYGPSYLYNTTSTNVDLELVVHVNESSESLKQEIQSYVRRAVDSANSNGELKVSKIISLLSKDETYGSYIEYVEFNGLNGTFTQYITKKDASDDKIRDYPPEWLNLDAEKISNIKVIND